MSISQSKKTLFKHIVSGLVLSASITTQAQSFDNCPTEAFLVQDTTARLYSVNLATGFYEEVASAMGTTGKINAIGFNVHDNYLYAFGYQSKTVVKIGADYQAVPLSVSNLPDVSFYVGDVSLTENSYYAYRSGGSYGLYKIDLSEDSEHYLDAQRVIDGSSLNLRIFDIAFHPDNNALYSVNSGGDLIKVDASDGSAITIGNVGESGTFGAVYFDPNGNFYISRNSDGFIFRINVNEANPTAEFFAFGPSSGNNDGARCAIAPLVSENSTIDFGDAPSSYGVGIEDNGARHEISENLYLGQNVSGEDDGVDFVTGFETGLDTLINVDATGEGYLNGWVDWDNSGSFEDSEIVIENKQMENGDNRILIATPTDAVGGKTWVRIRYSSTQDIGPNGGVSDGEVEDHEIEITPSGISIVSYPSANSYVSIAYEDNWPERGDYDMNDVVMAYRTKQYIDENERTLRYDIEGHVLAVGASYHNGFAVQLDGIETSNVNENLVRFEINNVEQNTSPLENNNESDDAVIILTDDLWDNLTASPSCSFYRTQLGCEEAQEFSFYTSIPLITSVAQDSAPTKLLNPFIFATPGHYHGDSFTEQPGRSLEIHLKNKKVSSRFNQDFFNLAQDRSDYANMNTFLNTNNMPWAIELPITWSHPREHIDLIDAYPEFSTYVESMGEDNKTWYIFSKSVQDKIIDNND